MRASQFFSRQKHEEGIKVLLPLPNGTDTTEFVILQGRDSAAFRKAQAAYRDRKFAAAVGEKKESFDSELEGIKLTASAIKSWSLEEPFTQEAAVELLSNAPYLLDKLDEAMVDNSRFFPVEE